MAWKIKEGTQCGTCEIPDKNCLKLMSNIRPENMFMNMADKKFYIFIHDLADCGGMAEVVEDRIILKPGE